jgi:HK97 family phage prohead protease
MPAISIDEFISKRSLSSHDGILYRAAKMPKSFNAESRSARFVMTDETKDSYGDIVRAKGAKLDRFMTNPICLLNHNSSMILGTWSDVEQKGKKVEGTATLAREGTAPHVDMAFNLMDQGILRAASIGFMPLSVERILDDNGEPTWEYDILEWDLYECSVVSIPANPSALAKSVKDGNMIARDWLEQVLDEYVKTPAGLILPRAEFEAAHKESTGQKTLIQIERPEWMDELKSMVETITKAAEPVTESDPEAEADILQKSMKASVEEAMREYDDMVEDIKSEVPKSRVKSLLDGIRSIFQTKSEPKPEPEGTPNEPAPIAALTKEQRAEILARASAFAPAN